MDKIVEFFSQNPHVLIIVESVAITLIVIIVLIFIDAYLDGREITFWPPKIGKKSKITPNNKIPPSLTESSIPATFNPITTNISKTDISLTSHALSDCALLDLSAEKIKDFIVEETNRHPLLFTAPFSSMPFIYSKNIIFLSCSDNQAIIERILLSRNQAYPASDSWFTCVSLYRQATAFSYRAQKAKAIIQEAEFRQIMNVYKKLLQNINEFVSLSMKEMNAAWTSNTPILNSLLDDAEFAFHRGNQDAGIVNLEALLSSIHKFLISNAPQAPSTVSRLQNKPSGSTPKLLGEGKKTILVIEDDQSTLDMISILLLEEGYRVATSENGESALKAIVENNYDLIITDIMMPRLNGYEVIIGCQTICPKTKLLIVTVLAESTVRQVISLYGNIYYLYKPFNTRELIELVNKLIVN